MHTCYNYKIGQCVILPLVFAMCVSSAVLDIWEKHKYLFFYAGLSRCWNFLLDSSHPAGLPSVSGVIGGRSWNGIFNARCFLLTERFDSDKQLSELRIRYKLITIAFDESPWRDRPCSCWIGYKQWRWIVERI